MEEIIEIAKTIQELRNIPQFLFIGGIHPESTLLVRQEILNFRKVQPEVKKIDFIINSPGGSPADAYRIIRTLRNNFEEVNIVVPFWAKSAATLLSLGGTKIIMDEFGEFGPLDIQIGVEREDSPEISIESALNDEYSVSRIEARSQELFYEMFINFYSNQDIKINKNELSNQLLRYLAAFYEPLLSQINPYNLGKKKRLLDIGEQYAQRILLTYSPDLPTVVRNRLIDYLVNGCPDHGYVIDYNLISKFLNNIVATKEIGTEYEDKIRNLTTKLIPLFEESYVGFAADGLKEKVKVEEERNQKPSQDVIKETTQKNSTNGKYNQT